MKKKNSSTYNVIYSTNRFMKVLFLKNPFLYVTLVSKICELDEEENSEIDEDEDNL